MENFKPMLATLVDQPFNDPDWEFEVKWDGYRALTTLQTGQVFIASRNGKSYNEKFFPIYRSLQQLKFDAVLDGEIVVLDKNGRSDFSSLQNWKSAQDGRLIYYVFDLLSFQGDSLLEFPLSYRRAKLIQIIGEENLEIKISRPLDSSGTDSFAFAKQNGLEGILAKRKMSLYYPGKRSHDWLKIKVKKRQEVVIAGYTNNIDSPRLFSALVLGVYDRQRFVYIGKVGTGFSEKNEKELMEQLAQLRTTVNPFSTEEKSSWSAELKKVASDTGTVWITPLLICEVEFSEITKEGFFRHPSFKGMRIDKAAAGVERETATPTIELISSTVSEKQL